MAKVEQRRPLVMGNWKMHGDQAGVHTLLQSLVAVVPWSGAPEIAVLPAFPHLAAAARLLEGSAVLWGAQDLSPHPQGPHTGDVSAAMLVDYNCHFVLIGHSERRQAHEEGVALLRAKLQAALDAGLWPVLCFGEDRAQRESGRAQEVVGRQLEELLEGCQPAALRRLTLAYEPVWAIGTGVVAVPEQAQEMHALLRGRIAARGLAYARDTRILYGGSVNAENAAALFEMPDVDGALVGGASLRSQEFLAICRAAGA